MKLATILIACCVPLLLAAMFAPVWMASSTKPDGSATAFKPITRQEYLKKSMTRFDRMDLNHNDVLDPYELALVDRRKQQQAAVK